jgi:hypothetical protein
MSFGNYRINFSKVGNVALSEVFGTDDLKPDEMISLLWHFVKVEGLEVK